MLSTHLKSVVVQLTYLSRSGNNNQTATLFHGFKAELITSNIIFLYLESYNIYQIKSSSKFKIICSVEFLMQLKPLILI